MLSPALQTEVPGGTQANLCDLNIMGWESFLYLTEPAAEAGTNIEIYSVGPEGSSEGDIVLYNIRFSRNLCGNADSAATLPDNLVEIKTAWRYIKPDTNEIDYYTIDATLNTGDQLKLGLIGFHLAQTTPLHPEMIWITWEHVDNAPDCVPSASSPERPANGWTMMTTA